MARGAKSDAARDIAHFLHPYTDFRRHEKDGPLIVTGGEGVFIRDDSGRTYLEGMAGLWCVSLGYGEERLVAAATETMRTLSFAHGFSHRSHRPGIELAERLCAMAPPSPAGPMSHALFANSGSEANDSAVKLVWYYNNARGRPEKKKIVARERAYHGVTVAAASLTGLPTNHQAFDLPIDRILRTDCPYYYRGAADGETEDAYATRLADNLDKLIRAEGPDTVAAFIAEPVMGAGGVIPPPAPYFDKIQKVLRAHDVLLIADEVICGFGRTGNMFGSETYGLVPDMVSVAKALTSAYLPMSALLISPEIYDAIASKSTEIGIFGHGVTYAGHPVCAAVALETLNIYEERDILGHVRALAPRFQDGLAALAGAPLVGEVRGVGLVAGVELVRDKAARQAFAPAEGIPAFLQNRALAHGLIVRAIGDTVALCPPLVIDAGETDMLLARFAEALADTEAEARRRGLI